ncbi:hypothetical protein Neosp_004226 [[Neocosmospora] mangrovei]
MLVFRGEFNHFSSVHNGPVIILIPSTPQVGTPFVVCWTCVEGAANPRDFLHSAVIQEVIEDTVSNQITATYQAEFLMELVFTEGLAGLVFRFTDDLGTSSTECTRDAAAIEELKKLQGRQVSHLYIGAVTDTPGATGDVLMIAPSDGIAEGSSVPVFCSTRSPQDQGTSMTVVNAALRNLHLSDQQPRSSSDFEFEQRRSLFRCTVEPDGNALTSTLSASGHPMRMAGIKMALPGGILGSTVTLKNNSCEILRYQISNSGIHVVEDVVMGILSILPVVGIKPILKLPKIIDTVTQVAGWISAGLSIKSMGHSFEGDPSMVRGLLYPDDEVKRTSTSSDIYNDNDVLVERFSFDESTKSIEVTTYKLDRAGNTYHYLNDLLEGKTLPSRWKPETTTWTIRKPDTCNPDRAIRVPNFVPKVGECTNLQEFRESVHGVFLSWTVGDTSRLPRLFPYTFSSNSIRKHETIGLYDKSKCSYYIQSKDGKRYGSEVKTLPNKGYKPVVILRQCCIRERGTLKRVKIGEANYKESADTATLRIIESEMDKGTTYWGVSVEENRTIYGYPEVSPSYTGDAWVLQKSDKSD